MHAEHWKEKEVKHSGLVDLGEKMGDIGTVLK